MRLYKDTPEGSTRAPVEEEEPTEEHTLTGTTREKIRTDEDLMRFLNIDPTLFSVTGVTAGSWQVKCAGEDVETLYKVQAHVSPVAGVSSEALLLPPPPMVEMQEVTGPLRCMLIIPDTQHGFRRDDYGNMLPLHDPVAIDIVIQVAVYLREQGVLERIVLCGDHLDLAPWSTKYRVTPDLHGTTNASLEALYHDICLLREVGACPIDWYEGNHEKRIEDLLAERAPEAWALRDPVTQLRVFSLRNLLHLDDLDVSYISPYGTRRWYWDDRVYGYHGTKVASKLGAVFDAHLSEGATSSFFGHIHTQGLLKKSLDVPGVSEIFSMSAGTLCQVNGRVPANLSVPPSWQQGFGVLWFDGTRIYPELISIQDGRCVWNGRAWRGTTPG